MVDHEFEWEYEENLNLIEEGGDPFCSRYGCWKAYSLHPQEKVGIYHEDDAVTVYDDRYLDIYGNIRSGDDW
jgi:hypothetical protein